MNMLPELLKTNYRVIAEQTCAFFTLAAILICHVAWPNGVPLVAVAYIVIAGIRALPTFKRIAELKQELS